MYYAAKRQSTTNPILLQGYRELTSNCICLFLQVCSEVVRELDFTNTALISDQGLLSLPWLPYLRKIDLNDTRTGTRDSVTSAGVEHVAKQCPNLQIAYFRRCRFICDKGI